jgi:hypothetical protein
MLSTDARDRLLGLAWFAFIPLTLWMMLALPLGSGPSLLVAAAVIAAHRPLARRFVFGRARRRCLWCGGALLEPDELRLAGVPPLFVCRAEQPALDRFLGFCARNGAALRAGILVPVLGYFLLGALAAAGFEPLGPGTRKTLFRACVALTVVSAALLHRRAAPERPEAFPLPVHNLALLGVRATLFVFLGVGGYWLALSAAELLL